MIDSIKEVERLTAVIREVLAERVRTALILGLDGSARSLYWGEIVVPVLAMFGAYVLLRWVIYLVT